MVTTVTDNSPQSINTSLFSLDKEVQEIKKVTDKLAGINTESGVISVNGKRGIVELNASDVKALPSSTVIPTTTSELENTSGFITSSDSITGNAATATMAEQDADGNVITDTYATKAELGNKVDKVSGKGLSTNDFTNAEKEKLAGLGNYDDSAVKTLIANETSERKTADGNLQTQITANKSAIDTLNGTGEGSVQKTVTDEIAKVVANAPEDFDTLKEISDWIDTHKDSASAMNTAISTNATNLSNHINNKSNPHSVTKAQVGLGNVVNTGDSATPVSGGTTKFTTGGAYTELAKKNNKITVSEDYSTTLTDDHALTLITAGANPTTGKNRKLSQVWTYIKGKADSIYAKLSHTHTKSQITDFPTSLPANGGTADKATKDGKGNNIADTYMPKSGGTFTGIVTGNEFHARSFFPKDNIDSQILFYPNVDGETKLIVAGYKSLELDSYEGDIFLKSEKKENALNKVVAKSYKVCKSYYSDPNIPTFLSNAELTNEHKKILRKIFGALCIGKCLSLNLEVYYNKPAGTKLNTLFRPLTIIGGQDWDFNDVTINKDGVTFDEVVDISNNYSYLGGLDDTGNFYSVDAYQLVTDIIKNDFSNVKSIKVFATIMENWV